MSKAIVWVIDDVATVRDSTRALLESYGKTVRDYASARAFLDDFDPREKGCLVVDLHMPEMNGLELVELLRGRGFGLPVIVITGRGDAALRERIVGAGAMAMLHKPVDDNELMRLIELALSSAD